MDDVSYFYGTVDELGPSTLYRVLALRCQVFVVARQRARLELDGLDIAPGTLHMWAERAGEPVAALRLVEEHGGVLRLGRLCTLPAERRAGLASTLVGHAVSLANGRPLVADVYTRNADWFLRRGFEQRAGRTVADGEPHVSLQYVPVRVAADSAAARHARSGDYRPAWQPLT